MVDLFQEETAHIKYRGLYSFSFAGSIWHCFPQSYEAAKQPDPPVKTYPCYHPAGSDLLTCRLLLPWAHTRAENQASLAKRTASMAAKYFYRQGFLLLLFNFISIAALEKRFSDFKRCADEECSSKFAGLEKNGLQGCIFPHPDTTASHKLRLISRPVANRYFWPESPPCICYDAV